MTTEQIDAALVLLEILGYGVHVHARGKSMVATGHPMEIAG